MEEEPPAWVMDFLYALSQCVVDAISRDVHRYVTGETKSLRRAIKYARDDESFSEEEAKRFVDYCVQDYRKRLEEKKTQMIEALASGDWVNWKRVDPRFS